MSAPPIPPSPTPPDDRAHQTAQRFRAAFDQNLSGMLLVATDGAIRLVNNAFCQMLGYPADGLLGKTSRDFTHPDDRARDLDSLRRLAAGEIPNFAYDKRYLRKDGATVWAHVSCAPIRDDAGQITEFFAVVDDVTHTRTAETALAASEHRLRLILEHVTDHAIFMMDPSGRITEWNVGAQRLFGFTEAEIIARESAVIFTPEDRAAGAHLQEMRTAAEKGCALDRRWHLRKDGSRLYADGSLQSIRNADGDLTGFVKICRDITEHHRLAQQLQQQSQMFETMLSAIADPIYILDLDGRFLYANKALLDTWGIPRDQAFNKSMAELGYPPQVIAATLNDLRSIASNRKPVSGETPYTSPTGAQGHYEYILSPVFAEGGADGAVKAVAGISREITERKRAQERAAFLIALDDATRPLVDPDAITQTSARLLAEFLDVDRCAYADVEADEDTFNLTGDFNRGVPSIVGRYRFQQFGEECLRLMRAGEPFVVTDSEADPRCAQIIASYRQTLIRAVICVSLKKEARFVAAMAVHAKAPRTWRDDEVALVQVVANRCWESIERARVSRALRESENYFRELAETMPQIVWTARPDGSLDYVNRRWFDYTHFHQVPAEQIPWNEAVHPDDLPALEMHYAHSIASGAPFSLEFRIRRHDSRFRWFLARALPVRTAAGVIQRWLGTCTDVHDAKLLQHQNESLLASERTAREAAELAQKRAEFASSAKDRFIAALSHELRTPLAPVLLALATLQQDTRLHPAFQPDLHMIRRNLDLEIRLIDDLLDLSRIRSGKLRLAIEPQHVHDLLRHAIAITASDVAAKRLRLHTSFDSPHDVVNADAGRLQQVFWNLIRNAVKFTPDSGDIHIHTEKLDGHLRVTVRDTGLGIPADALPRLFNAFEQGDSAVTRQFGGLGLGLSISKAIVDAHHGVIKATSEGPNTGATFMVELPLTDAVAPRELPAPDAPARGDHPLSGRVLLVEDHADTGRTLSRLLRTTGLAVEWANSRESALQLAAASPFDLVISDIGLPDASGYDLMRELKARYNLRGIALSGYGMEEDIKKSFAAGFSHHLVKPIDFDRLSALLHQLLT